MRVKKHSLLLVLLFCSFFAVFAGEVSQADAKKVAVRFYYERINQFRGTEFSQIKVSSTFVIKAGNDPVYYVFNINDQGFVIVSAEDNLYPVFGYSFESTYSDEDQPVQFIEWMQNCADQVVYHRTHQTARDAKITGAWDLYLTGPQSAVKGFTSKSVQPLLVSTWDQGRFYNDLCPAAAGGSGGHVWAGCVATAMAQVMYYYRFPEHGSGSHGYYSSYGYLSANFGLATYEWNQMLNSLSGPNLAVATLLLHLGISVDMMYSPSGSGAYSFDAANALKNYFHYSPNLSLEEKYNYSSQAWANLLISNLDAKIPMYYHGFGSGGHAFNVDGYQGSDFFHFNWGWSGSYNGYFYLDNLNPGGSNFSEGQGAIVGIYPDTALYNYPTYCDGYTTLSGPAGTFEDGSGPDHYKNNITCQWLIDPQVNPDDSVTSITLSFARFETEANFDKVTVYDGPNASDAVLGVFSGSSLPQSVTSTSNKMLIVFSTNISQTAGGWLASYKTTSPDYCDMSVTTLTEPSLTFDDGSKNKHYQNGTICQWLIQPENAETVTLSFNSFNTEPVNDFVQVYAFNPGTQNGTLLGEFSGNTLPPPLTSSTGAMFLIFYASQSTYADGWEASYTSTFSGIGEPGSTEAFNLFPNPASGSVQLAYTMKSAGIIRLSLENMSGKTVFLQENLQAAGDFRETLDLSGVSKGIYLLRLTTGKETITRKLAVQ